jgi:hypothetical protein
MGEVTTLQVFFIQSLALSQFGGRYWFKELSCSLRSHRLLLLPGGSVAPDGK